MLGDILGLLQLCLGWALGGTGLLQWQVPSLFDVLFAVLHPIGWQLLEELLQSLIGIFLERFTGLQRFFAAARVLMIAEVVDMVPNVVSCLIALVFARGMLVDGCLRLSEHAGVGLLQLLQSCHHQQPFVVLVVVLEGITDEVEILFRGSLAVDYPGLFLVVVVEVRHIGL